MVKRKIDLLAFEPLKLLSQDLAKRKEGKKFSQYAMLDEDSAVKIAKINAIIKVIKKVYPELKPLIPLLEMKREILIEIGRAKYISNASELTNLGLLTPKKVKKVDLSKEKE